MLPFLAHFDRFIGGQECIFESLWDAQKGRTSGAAACHGDNVSVLQAAGVEVWMQNPSTVHFNGPKGWLHSTLGHMGRVLSLTLHCCQRGYSARQNPSDLSPEGHALWRGDVC